MQTNGKKAPESSVDVVTVGHDFVNIYSVYKRTCLVDYCSAVRTQWTIVECHTRIRVLGISSGMCHISTTSSDSSLCESNTSQPRKLSEALGLLGRDSRWSRAGGGG